MKPSPFAYADPADLTETVELLALHGDEGKILAGGQSLVPLLNLRLAQPAVLIDLNRVTDLAYVRTSTSEDVPGIAFGAMIRQATIERMDGDAGRIPLLAEAIRWVGHSQIRARGTIGGSIAHADPAAELPLVFRALDGMATVHSQRGSRTINAADFFLYTFTPALEPDELLTEVWLPLPLPRTGQAFIEVARRHGDYALVAVGVSLTLGPHGHCDEARIALGGTAPVPARATAAEEFLRGERASLHLFAEAGRIASGEMEPTGDVHADADYRRDVASTLVSRALTIAFERVPKDDA